MFFGQDRHVCFRRPSAGKPSTKVSSTGAPKKGKPGKKGAKPAGTKVPKKATKAPMKSAGLVAAAKAKKAGTKK